MKFAQETEPMQHALAGQFPREVWDSLFKYHPFTDTHALLMQTPEDQIDEVLARDEVEAMGISPIKKRDLWIVLAFRRPKLSDSKLFQLLDKLLPQDEKGNSEYQLQALILFGNTGLIDQFMSDNAAQAQHLFRKTIHMPVQLKLSSIVYLMLSKVQTSPTQATISVCHDAFIMAIKNNDVPTINAFLQIPAPFSQKMMSLKHYEAFATAASYGNQSIMGNMLRCVADPKKMLEFKHYHSFFMAIQNEHFGAADYLKSLVPTNDVPLMFTGMCNPFKRISSIGGIHYLLNNISSDLKPRLIELDEYYVFRLAAKIGDIALMEALINIDSSKTYSMIAANQYESFTQKPRDRQDPSYFEYSEAPHGSKLLYRLQDRINVHTFLMAQCSEQQREQIISMDDYFLFRQAAGALNIQYMQYLIAEFPNKTLEMITAKDYAAFTALFHPHNMRFNSTTTLQAAHSFRQHFHPHNMRFNSTTTLQAAHSFRQHLAKFGSDKIQSMLTAQSYKAFSTVVECMQSDGYFDLDTIRFFIENINPDLLQDMLAVNEDALFSHAAKMNQLDALKHLISFETKKEGSDFLMTDTGRMISKNHYAAFQKASEAGNTEVMRYLIGLVPDAVIRKNMITSNQNQPFKNAIKGAHVEALKLILEHMPRSDQYEMLAEGDMTGPLCYGFSQHKKDEAKLTAMSDLLFTFAPIFAGADSHFKECKKYATPFAEKKIKSLKKAQASAQSRNSNSSFDVADPDEARLLFFILRHLIRHNKPKYNDDIQYLIGIPSVRLLLHTPVTHNQENELLRLAISLSNSSAMGYLLSVDAVSRLAISNNYYQAEANDGLRLRQLAEDKESSMTTLSADEQRRLASAIAHYEPIISSQGGYIRVFEELKKVLISRYNQNPAKITRTDNTEYSLPFNLGSILKDFDDSEKRAILSAYYQHKDHTAFRYLSKPNPWIAANASYINIDPNNPQRRWAMFQQYVPLISMLFLAAKDTSDDIQVAPCDGYTVETRLTQFIAELSMLGRAHNWDKTRLNGDRSEEYDDGEGDKPSCYSGVKRRLFQSVLGHPMFKKITIDDIKQLLRDFVRDQFKAYIDAGTEKSTLHEAWIAVCDYPTEEHQTTLKVMNIPELAQQNWLQSLAENDIYGIEFGKSPIFKSYIIGRFAAPVHATEFGGETGLTELFESLSSTRGIKRHSLGFFDQAESSSSQDLKRARMTPPPG